MSCLRGSIVTWLRVRAAVAAVFICLSPAAARAGADSALAADPPVDAGAPASGLGVRFSSGGAMINAQVYRPAGASVHPSVILLHGLPGNEQNLDLARAMQRGGWTVLTFHYRGSWGSGGAFSLTAGIADVDALLDRLETPGQAAAWGIDPARIVIMGHSYGGMAAAAAGVHRPKLLGVALLAPWDVSEDARAWAKLSDPERRKIFVDNNDIDGRLGPVSAVDVLGQIMRDGASLDLGKLAPALAPRPLLVVTATRDDPDDQAIALLAALKRAGAAHLTATELDTDHGFNDHRIALTTVVLGWLASVPGAPAQ